METWITHVGLLVFMEHPKLTLERTHKISFVFIMAKIISQGAMWGILMKLFETRKRVVVETKANARCKASGMLLISMALFIWDFEVFRLHDAITDEAMQPLG